MQNMLTSIPGWEKEMIGFNQGTLILLLGFVVLGLIARAVAMVIITKILSRYCEGNKLAMKTIVDSRGALGTAAAAAVIFFCLQELIDANDVMMPGVFERWAVALVHLAMLFAIIVWLFRLVGIINALIVYLDEDGELDASQRTLVGALESIMRFLIIIFGGAFIADALGFDLTTVIAGLGISGLAFALAAKDTISNIFGAVTVLLDRPFKVGDWIIVDAVEGEVIEIGLRTTLIRTAVDTIVTIPNANLVNTPVENWGKRRWRRYQPNFKLDINSDPEKTRQFCDDVMTLIEKHPQTLKEESSWVNIDILGPEAINVNVNMYWDIASSKDERKARDDFLLTVMDTAKDLGLNFFDPRVRSSK